MKEFSVAHDSGGVDFVKYMSVSIVLAISFRLLARELNGDLGTVRGTLFLVYVPVLRKIEVDLFFGLFGLVLSLSQIEDDLFFGLFF